MPSFFLPPDEAKSLGDIDYMRKSKRVRRTFPKTQTNDVTEVIKETSSMKTSTVNGNDFVSPLTASVAESKSESNQSSSFNTPASASTSTSSNEVKTERQKVNTGMDMFRNMAKDIRKKR